MALTDSDQQFEAAVNAAVIRCQAKPLPFVVPDPEDPNRCLSLWTVTETGDDLADRIMGLTFAEELMQRAKEFSKQAGVPSIAQVVLQDILAEMISKGRVGPVEQGFIWRIARAAMAGSFH
jgi:hypothetical protein